MSDFRPSTSARSISTTRGDAGQTGLAGGIRVSKSAERVEAFGTVDELNAALAFARSICEEPVIAGLTRGIQEDLFKLASALATPPESPKPQVPIDTAMVDRLTAEVHRIEAIEGMLSDWSLSGDLSSAAAFNLARTVCRRAERAVVRFADSGAAVQPVILAYLNRLSDLLWLFARQLEHDAGINSSLREQTGKGGNRWSRLVAAAAFACLSIHVWGPADLLAVPERPCAYGRPGVRMEGAAFPRFATGADDERVRIEKTPRRIVSQDAHADEYLYAVVPPERVVGVSLTAYDRRVSNVLELADRYRPVVSSDPEGVVRLNPDLVIAPVSARADVTSLLRHAGLPVYRLYTMFETLTSIEDHIRLIGYLTGEDARAAEEVGRFKDAVARAVARRPAGMPPPKVLGLGGAYSYGSKTLFADILRVLGAENVAARHGLVGYDRVTDEHIVRWDPEWIVAGADRGTMAETRARLLARPAIAATRAARHGHVVVFENQIFLPLSPFTAQLVEELSRALYAGSAS